MTRLIKAHEPLQVFNLPAGKQYTADDNGMVEVDDADVHSILAMGCFIVKDNIEHRDPTTDDDFNEGYIEGSAWHNPSDNSDFICKDARPNKAVWDVAQSFDRKAHADELAGDIVKDETEVKHPVPSVDEISASKLSIEQDDYVAKITDETGETQETVVATNLAPLTDAEKEAAADDAKPVLVDENSEEAQAFIDRAHDFQTNEDGTTTVKAINTETGEEETMILGAPVVANEEADQTK